MTDGVRLAGSLYLPEKPRAYPEILTYIPYLGGRGWLDGFQRHFASRGYAVLQLDFRGTGSSEGVIPHAVDPLERDDGHCAVEWIAEQHWCTGAVGMWGMSYGGLTALTVAMTQPPHLEPLPPCTRRTTSGKRSSFIAAHG